MTTSTDQGTVEEPPVEPTQPQEPQPQEPAQVQPESQAPQQPQPQPASTEGEGVQAPPERIVPAADGYKFQEGTPQQLGEIFNQLDLTQEQADGIIQLDNYRTQAQAEALRQAGQAHIEQWGDAKETNLNLARRGMMHVDPSGQLKEVLNQTGYGNDPRLLEMFYQFGKRMEEGGFLPSEVKTPEGKQDTAHLWYPEQAPGKHNPYKT